jgi:Transposase DDE domain
LAVLGAAPLAAAGAPGAWLGSQRLMAIDGVKLDVPDTPVNVAGFGRPGGLTRRPFPQVQVLGLGECGTHAVVAAQIGTLSVGERELAGGLLARMAPGMLVIADRGFFSFEFWRDCLLTGADLLFRAASGLKLPVTRVLPDGSYLSEIATHKVRSSGFKIPLATAADPRNATHIPVRVIEYTVTTAAARAKPEIFRLITTILDPDDVTAIELAAYQQRWEYEISLREIETQMLQPGSGLRSRTPELVRQELWGLLLAHYAVRSLMAEASAAAGFDPDRLSFMRSISLIRRQVTDQAAFPPGRLEHARVMAVREILERVSEPFPSGLCLAELQYVDGFGELPGAPGAAAELAEDAPGLELGVRTLAGCAELRVRFIGLLLGLGFVLPAVRDLRVRASLVALMGSQRDQARGLQLGQDAPDPLGLLVVHRSGQRAGHPHDIAVRAGDDLQVHPVLLVFAGVERPVRGDPVDRDQRAVDDDVGVPGLLRVADRGAQLRGAGGQQGDGLGHVPPGGRGADAEPRGELGECLAFAQVGQDQQRLLAGVQLPPVRPDSCAVAADDPGHEGERLAGQRQQRGTVEQHESP